MCLPPSARVFLSIALCARLVYSRVYQPTTPSCALVPAFSLGSIYRSEFFCVDELLKPKGRGRGPSGWLFCCCLMLCCPELTDMAVSSPFFAGERYEHLIAIDRVFWADALLSGIDYCRGGGCRGLFSLRSAKYLIAIDRVFSFIFHLSERWRASRRLILSLLWQRVRWSPTS